MIVRASFFFSNNSLKNTIELFVLHQSMMTEYEANSFSLTRDGAPYDIETSEVVYTANQLTGFYLIGSSVIKE